MAGQPRPQALACEVEVLEVVLLHVEHDVAYQVHAGGLVLTHLGHQAMERGSDGPDGIVDCDGHGVVDSVEDVNCHRPAAEFFHSNIDLRREAYVVGGDSLDIKEQGGGSRLHE